MEYARRIVDAELDELQSALPAVALQGPKGVGKTATALQRANSIIRLDEADQREIVSAAPERLTSLPPPVLLDEWQRLPEVWDRVRRAVDKHAEPGRFILTGSANPVGATIHSGAGRIVDLRMRPLSLAERALVAPTVSLRRLLDGDRPSLVGDSPLTLPDYTDEILRSGFPGIRPLPERARRAQLDGYISAIVSREFAEQGVILRRPETLRGWLASYAAATSTTTSFNTILEAATPGQSPKPSRDSASTYRDILSQLWLLDPIPAWLPSYSMFSRLGKGPKHQLADPALAARLLNADHESLLNAEKPGPAIPRNGSLLGSLFEHLVGLSVTVYAQASEARVGHLRAHDGRHEIDLIVERGHHHVVALEVKLSPSVDDRDVRHLHWAQQRLGDRLLDAAVITTGREAYRRQDGIAVIPAALLGP